MNNSLVDNTTYSTDWLASRPVYYNEKTKKISHSIYDVIDYANIEIDPEGFNNYLAFGYSVLGQTPLRHVKYLPHSSDITVKDGALVITTRPDVVDTYTTHETNEQVVIDQLNTAVTNFSNRTEKIILPLSGGFDSRLLAFLLPDRSKVHAFTYGTATHQAQSFEVVNAKTLAEDLGIAWNQITLNTFFTAIPEWENWYGPATHAHGMYQVEFYTKIKNQLSSTGTVLSGIIGDAWAGSVKIKPIENPGDVVALGYSHGMHADREQSLLRSNSSLIEQYFVTHKERLSDPRQRVIESMRFKMVLLSYLTDLPKKLGFDSWSPFIEPDIALSMLMLPTERRQNRQWQRDFFAQHSELQLEKIVFKNRKNTLNLDQMREYTFTPLSVSVLEEYVSPKYLEWINTTLHRAPRTLCRKYYQSMPAQLFSHLPIAHSIPDRFGFDWYTLKNEESRALSAYLTLHPIQTILDMRR